MTKFSSTCWTMAKMHGPLNVETWDQVDPNVNTLMWNELQKYLVYPPGSGKMICLEDNVLSVEAMEV
uniref:Uncharacterized protein n=1 Tax=Oryza punctata TaxID=4537 RepID=A0A0E0KFZ3_ORYPU